MTLCVQSHVHFINVFNSLQSICPQLYTEPEQLVRFDLCIIELCLGQFRGLLAEKRSELGQKAAKLKSGLGKLEETGVQVAGMQLVCVDKKKVVAEAKAACEELLVEIVQDKRAADEQEKQVAFQCKSMI